MSQKMHKNERVVDVALVRKLLQNQFPEWANLSIKLIRSIGADNVVFKLGIDKCIRLPKTIQTSKQICLKAYAAKAVKIFIKIPLYFCA